MQCVSYNSPFRFVQTIASRGWRVWAFDDTAGIVLRVQRREATSRTPLSHVIPSFLIGRVFPAAHDIHKSACT